MTIESAVSELYHEQMSRRVDMAIDTFLQLFISNILKTTKVRIMLLYCLFYDICTMDIIILKYSTEKINRTDILNTLPSYTCS